MARTVIVFRDTMIERERLACRQAETSEERERRAPSVGRDGSAFRVHVETRSANCAARRQSSK